MRLILEGIVVRRSWQVVPGVFTTEDVDDLMEHVALHAKRVHPKLELTPEVVEQAKGMMGSS